MAHSRSRVIATLVLATLIGLAPCAPAQIIEDREYHGKKIMCALSGLQGFSSACGLDRDDELVLIGSVLSFAEISDTEFQVELRPEEVFLGEPPRNLEVTTNQGACLPELAVGDHWLFYLRRDKTDHRLYLDYGSGSAPEKDAQGGIALLRRLSHMDNSGVVKGYVQRVDDLVEDGVRVEDHVDLPNHKIIATPKPDGKPFTTSTDKDGSYEFESLPVGKYELSANTAQGLWAEEGPVEVQPHSCTAVGFQLEPAGTIAGQVTTPDGKPARFLEVYAIAVSDTGKIFDSTSTNAEGHYEIKGLRPGRYAVGIQDGPQTFSGSEMKLSFYYPGVRARQQAIEIDLDKAGSRTDIDFQVPLSAVPRADDPGP